MLFARLSAFSGGCSLEAVEAICDAEGDLLVDIREGLSSLVDKSILRQEEKVEEEPRFVMLETIREYARERLEVGGNAKEIRGCTLSTFSPWQKRANRDCENQGKRGG